MEKRCSSCGAKIVNETSSVSFKCPECLKTTIVRCGKCRTMSIPYKCPNCGFEGP